MTPGTTLLVVTVRTDDGWGDAVQNAYDRLALDPRCKVESIRAPELHSGNRWHVTCDTKGGDVLRVVIFDRR